MQAHTYTFIYVQYTNKLTSKHTCIHTYTYPCVTMHACVYICLNIRTYAHAHTNTHTCIFIVRLRLRILMWAPFLDSMSAHILFKCEYLSVCKCITPMHVYVPTYICRRKGKGFCACTCMCMLCRDMCILCVCMCMCMYTYMNVYVYAHRNKCARIYVCLHNDGTVQVGKTAHQPQKPASKLSP